MTYYGPRYSPYYELIRRKKMRLKKGDKVEELSLPSTNNQIFNIESIYGKRTLITFYRFATCPFCNLRIYEINKRKSELGNDFKIVAIFDSNIDFLIKSMKKHDTPFIILADENFKYFKKFEVEKSLWKFLIGTTLGFFRFLKALSMGYLPLIMKGSLITIPVDILIKEDGIIEKVYYGRNTADHLSFEEIKRFSLQKNN